ncbi:hypothetical protein Ddc_01747 [Ditylenchus destructor]|nr:hypothetical protein Ddc_01747 [Ditylenchus destructor]
MWLHWMAIYFNDILYDIFVFFSRLKLIQTSKVNRRWKSIIEQKINDAPYFIVDRLEYGSNCSIRRYNRRRDVDANVVAKAKFLRARETIINFSSEPIFCVLLGLRLDCRGSVLILQHFIPEVHSYQLISVVQILPNNTPELLWSVSQRPTFSVGI